MSHPELQQEQAYVDHAYECLDKMRKTLEGAQDKMATEFAALAIEAWMKRRQKTFIDAERGLCFGRLTLDGLARPLYVGRRWVHDDRQDVLVCNWQAPAARPFYTATPADPQRVTQRRRYRTSGRKIEDISDESLDGTAVEGATVSDFLLEELERRREGRMRDIVATIQSDQYRLITADPDRALVVQGGPGTGKTAVGLHRASWLLYTHREQLRRVLVVGPNPTFMEYVSHVLPALGEEAVEQRAVSELLDGVSVEGEDALDVARLKADTRLAEVVTRAVEQSLRPTAAELVLYVDGEFVRVREREVAALIEIDDDVPLAVARERFRMAVLRRFYERYGEKLGERALRSFDDLERALKNKGFLAKYLDHVFAVPRADRLVARLLTSPAALREAADGILDAREQKLLLRDRPRRAADLRWSVHDLPLLDVARTLIDGPPRAYGHVIVDEAQDLSPMQLLAISRRTVDGSLTMLGDVAQATGPVVYRRWEELRPYLPGQADVAIEELRHAYRVPAEIMELALPLLDEIAPEVERPLAYRRGGAPPRLVSVAEPQLMTTALREAAELDGLLAVIAPPSLAHRSPHGDAFDEVSVPVLTPRQAKGLEFDHVVVVEPAAIAAEGGDSGLRELYVALTRPTKTLVVVHSRRLPPVC
ncbi:MAG TPA: ATP-binding domain-containing protein [Gaiellaceae bacterium]